WSSATTARCVSAPGGSPTPRRPPGRCSRRATRGKTCPRGRAGPSTRHRRFEMANGDAAAAKGLHVVEQTDDVKIGYDDINIRGDELAAEIDARIAGDALAFPA